MNAILFMEGTPASRPQSPATSAGKPGALAESAAGALFAVVLQQAVSGTAVDSAAGGQAVVAGGSGGAGPGGDAATAGTTGQATGQAAGQGVQNPPSAELSAVPMQDLPQAETGAPSDSTQPARPQAAPAAAGAQPEALPQGGDARAQQAEAPTVKPSEAPTVKPSEALQARTAEAAPSNQAAGGAAVVGPEQQVGPAAGPESTVQVDGKVPKAVSEAQAGLPAAAAAEAQQAAKAESVAGRKGPTQAPDAAETAAEAPGPTANGVSPLRQAAAAKSEQGRAETAGGLDTREKGGKDRQGEAATVRPDGNASFPQQTAPAPTTAARAPQAAPAPELTQPRDILSQVISQVKVTLQGDRTEARIHLVPENLGPVDLKVTMEGGQLTARFHVVSGQVREILEQHLPELKQALQDQGFRVEQFSVSLGTGSAHQDLGQGQQAQAQAQAWQARTARYGRYREEAAPPEFVTARSGNRGAPGRLDLIA